MSELIPPQKAPTETPGPSNNNHHRLAIFGLISILLAIITSSLSLFIYTASGDIYLDRSRPGFISDDEPPANNTPADEVTPFSPDGQVSEQDLADYLKKLDQLTQDILGAPEAFSSEALSDDALNITGSLQY